jgi:hypothetical protein
MRASFFLLALASVSLSAFALRNVNKWRDNCEGGISRACYEYGIWLQTQPEKRWKDLGARYVRRACSMAYAPACQTKAQSSVVAFKPVIKEGYVQPQLPTEPVKGTSPVAAVPTSTHKDPSLEDMKDIQELQKYHDALKTAANGILSKGRGAGFKVDMPEPETQAPEGPPAMSVWEQAGFRATPLMIRLVGARNFRATSAEPVTK